MGAGGRGRLRESGRALGAVVANRQLLRVEIARGTIAIGLGVYGIVFIVLAYRAGGVAAVGVLSVVRLLTTATAAPFGALLGDRFPRPRVMLSADLFRAAVVAAAALAAASDPSEVLIYAFGALTAVAGTVSAPARAALIPALVRSPDQLAAANVVGSTSEGLAALAGPALGGTVLALAGAEAALLVAAAACLVSALLVSRIEVPGEIAARPRRPGLWRAAADGFRPLVSAGRARPLALLYVTHSLATGVLATLLVVAVIELLELGEAGVGYASAVISIGGLAGGAVALVAVGGRALWRGLVGGALAWAAAVMLVAGWPEPAAAFAAFGAIGLADSVVKVSGTTLFQRVVADEVLARAFGALAAILFTVAALGALLAPVLDGLLGTRGALLVTGAAIVPVALLSAPALRRLDRPRDDGAREALAGVPFLGMLPPDTLERLAARAEPLRVAAGARVFAQGDPGDRFYVVSAGSAAVCVDGTPATVAGPGEFFGEIALIRDVPRTATVEARDELELWALGRDDLLDALAANPGSLEDASAIAAARLSRALPLDLA